MEKQSNELIWNVPKILQASLPLSQQKRGGGAGN